MLACGVCDRMLAALQHQLSDCLSSLTSRRLDLFASALLWEFFVVTAARQSKWGSQQTFSDWVRTGGGPLPPGDAASAAAVSDFWLSSDMRGALWVRCAVRPSLPATRTAFISSGNDCSLTVPVLEDLCSLTHHSVTRYVLVRFKCDQT